MSFGRLHRCVLSALLGGASCLSVPAQSVGASQGNTVPVAAAPAGEVTGTVIAADTQRPVRFAQVTLQSVESAANAGGESGGVRDRILQRVQARNVIQGATDLDGTFTLGDVAPGDYYVTASAPGFLAERAVLLTAIADGADPAQLLAGIPVAHVAAYSSSRVVLTLQRGGALAGRVVWEDGSGVSGAMVMALSTVQRSTALPGPLQGLQVNGISQYAQTDDRGEFRIAGLPSGDYYLQATLQSGGRFGGRPGFVMQREPATVSVYATGVFRRSKAKTYSVRAGDERNDVRVAIDLRGLHTVSGHVGSSDANLSVAAGRVFLRDDTDPSLTQSGAIDAEGGFSVRFVPSGSYKLQVIGASNLVDGLRGRNDAAPSTPVVSFQPSSQPLVVTDTDVTGVAVTLTPAPTH